MSYLDQCECEELFYPRHSYRFLGNCTVTGQLHSVEVPGPELFAYRQGKHIQTAMPSVSSGDREFLMTGISPEGWDKMFHYDFHYSDEEEDETADPSKV